MIIAASKLDLNRQLDNDLFNHITYVSNRIMFVIKNEGLSNSSKKRIFSYLFRLYRVFQAYNEKNRKPTIKKVYEIAKKMIAMFG